MSTPREAALATALGRAPIETWAFGLAAALALAAAAVTAVAAPGLIPVGVQIAAVAALAAVLGLPHGALDPLIAKRTGLWRGPLSFAAFNLGYLAIVAAVVGVWFLAPLASLIAFLLVSAAHFGGDWNGRRPLALRLVTGTALLSLPAFGHRDDVAAIYETLAPGGANVAAAQANIGPFAIAVMLLSAALAWRTARHESIELVLASALAVVTPPLVFFVVYFCALHSFRHIRLGFAEERARLSSSRSLFGIVIGYTVAPIVAAIALLVAVNNPAFVNPAVALDDALLRILFIGLAALTVPHMLLVRLGEIRANRPPVSKAATARSEAKFG